MPSLAKMCVLAVATATLVGGCSGSSSHSAAPTTTGPKTGAHAGSTTTTTLSPVAAAQVKAGDQLSKRIIIAPVDYVRSTAAGTYGTITPEAFNSIGGSSAADSGFVIGYRTVYVTDPTFNNVTGDTTDEGVSVTLLQFKSAAQASAYLDKTRSQLLGSAAPTYKPFPNIPNAVQADYTKAMSGQYPHAVAMTRGSIYALLEYVNAAPSTVPLEFKFWVAKQYSLL